MSKSVSERVEYSYPSGVSRWPDRYIWDAVERLLESVKLGTRTFELGCGNGVHAAQLRARGLVVTAVDPSESGIREAKLAYPDVEFHAASTDEDLSARFGRFPLLISIEVVEHCYSAVEFAQRAFELLEPGGLLILTTPYHGYWKNLAIALTGKFDAHVNPLWEGGHIKFFSIATISSLLRNAGFEDLQIIRVGRVPPLAKSIVVTARRPVLPKSPA